MAESRDSRRLRLAGLEFETFNAGVKGSGSGTVLSSIREIFQRRNVLGLFVKSELKTRYKDSSLGVLWALIKPLVMLGIYYFAIGKVLGAERSIPAFAIFVFTGLTLWGFFAETVTLGTSAILRNSGLVKKIYLPRELFPLAGIGSAGFNFLVQFAVLLVATFASGLAPLHWKVLFVIPSVLIVLIFGTAFAIALSALTVYLRDLQYLVEVVLMIGFWLSPVVYSFGLLQSSIPSGVGGEVISQIYLSNPLTVAVMGFQSAMWISGDESNLPISSQDLLLRMLVSIVLGFIFLVLCQKLFTRLEGNFAQEL